MSEEKSVKFRDMPLGDMSQFDPEKFLTDLTPEDQAAMFEALRSRIAKYRAEYEEAQAAAAEGKKPPPKKRTPKSAPGNLDLSKPIGE